VLIGIDPGVTGAIAFLRPDLTLVSVEDMPTMLLTGKKQQVNGAALTALLNKLLQLAPGSGDTTAYLERVSAMPRQGVSSMFNFGTGYGVIQGVLAALHIPTVLVSPAQWKKRAGLRGKEKDAGRTLAQQLYPEAPLGRKKDIGRADAILIARFGK